MIIAIDGPAASGKSTTAKMLASKLKFIHLNSGIMYRAITYIFIQNNMLNETDKYINKFLIKINLKFKGKNLNIVMLDDCDISDKLYTEEISKNIRVVSNNLLIRKKLIKMQRELVNDKNVVCEGRDIGTVVFPKADFKFYLNANLNKRVERRFNQIFDKNEQACISEIKENLIHRDLNDIRREHSPLKKADDSIEIDTTNLKINEQVEKIYNIIKIGK